MMDVTAQERVYPCDKVLMINAIGDIIDEFDGTITLSDTERGRLNAKLKNRDNFVNYCFSVIQEDNICRLRIETGDKTTPPEKLARENRQIETLFSFLDEMMKHVFDT